MNKSKWRGYWKKIAFILLLVTVCAFTLIWNPIVRQIGPGNPELKEQFKESLLCFEQRGSQLLELNEEEPNLGSCIFFHETSCPNDSDIILRARQSCSIESALRANPKTDVFLLMSAPTLRPLEETENLYIPQLLTYPNFKVRHITFSKYLSNTPLDLIYLTGALNSSLWPVEHTSDVLRYATLYKFGGIYLDLDVIVLKSLSNLRNFAAVESNLSIGSGILGFSFDKVGREVAKDCATELASTYRAKSWGFNGPGVITRVMEQRCRTTEVPNMVKNACKGFKVYPAEYFQAISFEEPELLFREGFQFSSVLTMATAVKIVETSTKCHSSTRCENQILNVFYLKIFFSSKLINLSEAERKDRMTVLLFIYLLSMYLYNFLSFFSLLWSFMILIFLTDCFRLII